VLDIFGGSIASVSDADPDDSKEPG